MSLVVGVHGIGQELLGPRTLVRSWLDPLNDGLERAGASALRPQDFEIAFYGDLYRQSGHKSSQIPPYDAGDVEAGLERELLLAWWRHGAEVDPGIAVPADTKARAPASVQTALDQLCRSRYFGRLTPRLLIWNLKQVARYFTDRRLRAAARGRLADRIGPDTRVVVGHSLGSVVAYETLCASREGTVRALVTLGSPLGIRNLIFDRLDPSPVGERGTWPSGLSSWTNVADGGDIVALVKRLRPLFGDRIQDLMVHNGSTPHDVTPYLTAMETGHAVATGLARR